MNCDFWGTMKSVSDPSNHHYGKNRTLSRMSELQNRADGWANLLRHSFMDQGVDVLFLDGSVLAVEAWCDQERLWRECIRGTMAVPDNEIRFVERLLADQGYRFGPPPRDMDLLLATKRSGGRSSHALVDQGKSFKHDPRSMKGQVERGQFLREAMEPIQSYWHRHHNKHHENEPRLVAECLGLRTTALGQ